MNITVTKSGIVSPNRIIIGNENENKARSIEIIIPSVVNESVDLSACDIRLEMGLSTPVYTAALTKTLIDNNYVISYAIEDSITTASGNYKAQIVAYNQDSQLVWKSNEFVLVVFTSINAENPTQEHLDHTFDEVQVLADQAATDADTATTAANTATAAKEEILNTTSDNIAEGNANLFYTTERADLKANTASLENVYNQLCIKEFKDRMERANTLGETVTFVGCSQIYGFRFDDILASRYPNITHIDKGVPGDTVTKVYQRIDDILSSNANLYVINVGSADIRYEMTTIEEYLVQMGNIYNAMKDTADVAIIGIFPLYAPDTVMDYTISNPLIDARNSALMQWCYDRKIMCINPAAQERAFINSEALVTTYIPDGVHTSPLGSALRADILMGNRLNEYDKMEYHTISVSDSFDRSNNTTTLGNTDTGQTWQAISGTWGISNNWAYRAVHGVATNDLVLVSGQANCAVGVKFSKDGFLNRSRLAFRIIDVNNFYTLTVSGTSYIVYKWTAGVQSTILTISDVIASVNDEILIVMSNKVISIYINSIRVAVFEDLEYNTASLHGLNATSGNYGLWNDFKILT